jgi:hypothetical protein
VWNRGRQERFFFVKCPKCFVEGVRRYDGRP